MKAQSLLLSTILFMLITIGCQQSISGSNFKVEEEKIVTRDSIDYLALGDSYTIGQSVEPAERWPNQLVSALKSEGYNVRNFKIIAQTGWTTTNLLTAIETSDLDQYNLVSLLIGVNNQFQGKPFELFEEEFALLLLKAIDLAGGRENVFVVSIPDYGVTPFGLSNSFEIAEELDQYNDHMKAHCKKLDIPFVDITSISRILGSSEGALASDNLHPSGTQYSKWLGNIYPVVEELLQD